MKPSSQHQDALVLLSFLSLRANARGALLHQIQKREWIIRSRNWGATRHPALLIADVAVEVLETHLAVPAAETYLPGELQALLEAMIALPGAYEYVWNDNPEEGITGPASRLWRLVERVARQILGELGVRGECSLDQLQNLVDVWWRRRIEEKASERAQRIAIQRALKRREGAS